LLVTAAGTARDLVGSETHCSGVMGTFIFDCLVTLLYYVPASSWPRHMLQCQAQQQQHFETIPTSLESRQKQGPFFITKRIEKL
jgi:hypothetical protein